MGHKRKRQASPTYNKRLKHNDPTYSNLLVARPSAAYRLILDGNRRSPIPRRFASRHAPTSARSKRLEYLLHLRPFLHFLSSLVPTFPRCRARSRKVLIVVTILNLFSLPVALKSLLLSLITSPKCNQQLESETLENTCHYLSPLPNRKRTMETARKDRMDA